MATYLFRAYDNKGTRVSGARKFDSTQSLQTYLNNKGYENTTIFESETKFNRGQYSIVSPRELAIFCRQMSVLFFSQITLMEGVMLLSEQAENKQLKIALKEIHTHMEKGYTFAEAMGMYNHIFGNYLLNMVTIGETSGTLDRIFANMSDFYDKEHKIRRKLKSAVTYPAILTVLMGAIVLLLILKILPMFQDILHSMGGDMPGLTKVILAASSFINSYLLVFVIIIVLIIVGLKFFASTEEGKKWFDKIKVTIPISRYIFSRVITARFARSLSILLKSGVQLLNAMDEIKTLIDNAYIEEKYEKCVAKVKTGEDLSVALSELGILPPLFLKMVVIGQQTGNLDDMLDKSANVFDQEVDEAIERLTLMIEPILIIGLSIIVGVILVSVMLPMIDIMNKIA